MQYDSVNSRNNSTIAEAARLRTILRRLGVQVGEMSVNPSSGGMVAVNSIPESEFVDMEFDRGQPLNLSLAISGWGQDCEALVAEIRRQFTLYGLMNGLRTLIGSWGCRSPEGHISMLPGVGTAMADAILRLANINVTDSRRW